MFLMKKNLVSYKIFIYKIILLINNLLLYLIKLFFIIPYF